MPNSAPLQEISLRSLSNLLFVYFNLRCRRKHSTIMGKTNLIILNVREVRMAMWILSVCFYIMRTLSNPIPKNTHWYIFDLTNVLNYSSNSFTHYCTMFSPATEVEINKQEKIK